jgi:hypothetical protein
MVHIISPKQGNVERYVRHVEDAVLLRLAARKLGADGGEGRSSPGG